MIKRILASVAIAAVFAAIYQVPTAGAQQFGTSGGHYDDKGYKRNGTLHDPYVFDDHQSWHHDLWDGCPDVPGRISDLFREQINKHATHHADNQSA